jgi:diphosphomevalonate decarboxylase
VSQFLDLVRGPRRPACARRGVDREHRADRGRAGLLGVGLRGAGAWPPAGRAGLQRSPAELSALARQGSGSAARSIFGGFVEMSAGTRADGSDAVAHCAARGRDWPLRLVVALTATGPKAIGSTAAMDRTAATSPYYAGWLASVPVDLAEARDALAARDLPAWGRWSSGARCACTPRPWPPSRPSSTGRR